MPTRMSISAIDLTLETQAHAGLDAAVIRDYAACLQDGQDFPPVRIISLFINGAVIKPAVPEAVMAMDIARPR